MPVEYLLQEDGASRLTLEDGTGFLLLESSSGAVAIMEAGVVPIRYVLGMIPNVVPVETVGGNEAGVVPCREFVGPANVVPVRETTETPRVKIRIV